MRSLRWQCRSSSTPTVTPLPTISRAAATSSPSQSSCSSATIAPWRSNSTMSTGPAARRSASTRSRRSTHTSWRVGPPGGAKAARLSTTA